MSEEILKTESDNRKYLIFSLAVFCFVIIPAMILYYSVYRYCISEEERLAFGLKMNMQRMASDLSKNLSAETFFCRLFHEFNILENNKLRADAKNTVYFCKQLSSFFGDGVYFLVINDNNEILYNTVPFYYPPEDWKNSYNYIRSLRSHGEKRGSQGSLEAMKKTMGPLITNDSFTKLYSDNGYSLCWGDSAGKIPPSGIYLFNWGGLFVFVSKDQLESTFHLKYDVIAYSTANNVIGGLYNYHNIDETFWSSSFDIKEDEIKKALILSELHRGNYIETDNYHVCHQYLSKDTRAFIAVKKENIYSNILLKSFLAFILYCILSWPIIKYGWNTIVLNIPGDASIRLKLGFLFFFACGIPLLTLGIIAKEYNLNKRLSLIEEARGWSVENLLGVEQRYSSFLKDICSNFDAYIDEWGKGLKNQLLTKEYSKVLAKKFMEYDVVDYYCVASESKRLVTYEGLIRYNGSLDSSKVEDKNCDLIRPLKHHRYEELRIANIIMKKICSDLNGTAIPSYILSKLEIIAETMIQKTFPEILCSVLETIGSIKEWGFWKNTNMTYFRFLSLYDPQKIDYIVVAAWKLHSIQKLFVEKILPKANRNPRNFKFIAYNKDYKHFIPNIYNKNYELRKFADRAEIKPTEELEIIHYDGEDYIAVSFVGRQLNKYAFIGLYPLRNIDNVIYEQSSLLWILGFLCLLLAAGLAQLLTKSFVNPLLTLQEAAQAIEARNAKYRLSTLAKDEFGEVGAIFNNVMVGLEELEIAKIVQESMFPKHNFSQGKFTVFGKTVTMIDVGGDYLDFFNVDDNSFSLLVGDVAGHGVGAAVIMAMAKATVLATETPKSPAAVLNQLHKVVLAAKNSKQKKIMTFQYIHVNSDTAEALYGNAGACSPWLVKHEAGTVEELSMAGAALGAFKRAVYKEIPIKFEDGDALVFYTDGIVECKNDKGEMLGFDNLKNLVLRCWDSDVEKYYQNIYNEYLNYIGDDALAGDDLTIAILMYKDTGNCADVVQGEIAEA